MGIAKQNKGNCHNVSVQTSLSNLTTDTSPSQTLLIRLRVRSSHKSIFSNYLLLVALGLCCCVRALSSCSEQGLLFVAAPQFLIAVVSHGRAWAGTLASVVVAHGLSCSTACGIFLDQGSNPCTLRWQVDSCPLCHQGSPQFRDFY